MFFRFNYKLVYIFTIISASIYPAFDQEITSAHLKSLGDAGSVYIETDNAVIGNPAPLGNLTNIQLNLTFLQNISSFDAGVNQLNLKGNVNFSLREFGGIGFSIDNYTVSEDGKPFYYELELGIGYAYKVIDIINVGASFLFQRWKNISDSSLRGDIAGNYFNLNAGIMASSKKGITAGICVKNLINKISTVDNNKAYTTASAGLAYYHSYFSVLLEDEYEIQIKNNFTKLGLEAYVLNRMLRFSTGINIKNMDLFIPSFGIGFQKNIIKIAYTFYMYLPSEMPNNHIITLSFLFNPSYLRN